MPAAQRYIAQRDLPSVETLEPLVVPLLCSSRALAYVSTDDKSLVLGNFI